MLLYSNVLSAGTKKNKSNKVTRQKTVNRIGARLKPSQANIKAASEF